MRKLHTWLVLSALAFAACGAEPAPAEPPPAAAPSSGGEAEPVKGGMQVEGIMGTIPSRRIEDTMQAKLPAFQRCFFEGAGEVEFIAGYVKFYFRVGLDGRVEWVHPRGSSVGHRGTELCLLNIAKQTHFPKPQGGGAAEFVWGFELETPDGVRAPVAWDEARVAATLTKHRASLDACELGDGHYVITTYVAPGGSVLAAGAAADSQPAAEKIDCVLGAIKGWSMPDPGSYAAKVSFHL